MEFKMNIPIYRAKKIDSDEYVEGLYLKVGHEWYNEYYYFIAPEDISFYERDIDNGGSIISLNKSAMYEIDQSTLSIYFPDMIDIKGNKIFASLSEDGKGGDIIIDIRNRKLFYYMANNGNLILSSFENINPIGTDLSKVKVIGIQQ